MISVNISIGKKYLTQLNNKISPHSTCNVTSAIMGLEASSIMEFDHDNFETQPEDVLALLLTDDGSYEKMAIEYPWATRDGYEPYEVHGMLEWGINLYAGQICDHFTTKGRSQDMFYRLLRNETATLVSGRFTKYGHIVCVVGFESHQDSLIHKPEDIELDMISKIIIDDPYGNYYTGYADRNGDNVEMTWEDFNDITKIYGDADKKWMHIFTR